MAPDNYIAGVARTGARSGGRVAVAREARHGARAGTVPVLERPGEQLGVGGILRIDRAEGAR